MTRPTAKGFPQSSLYYRNRRIEQAEAKAKAVPETKPPPKAKANFAVPKTKAIAKTKAAAKAKAQPPVRHVCPQCNTTWFIDDMDRDFHVTAEVWERFGCTICPLLADAEGDSSDYEHDTQGFSQSNKDYSSSEPPLRGRG